MQQAHPSGVRSRSLLRAAAAVALSLALAATAGCGGDDEPASSTTTTSAAERTTTTPTSTAEPADEEEELGLASTTSAPDSGTDADGATTSTSAATATTTAGATTPSDPVPDGTSFAYLRGVDVGGSTVTVDIAQLLTGDEAVKAAIADGFIEGGETSVPNDYYIRNQNPKLRIAPVAPTAAVNVLDQPGSPDLIGGSLAVLSARVAERASVADDPGVPVQIVATAGVVSRIDEVFFP